MYPLLSFFIAGLWNVQGSKKMVQYIRISIVFLIVWYVYRTVSIAPHYLSYANELIGGPRNLWKYVADSNIEWGQNDIYLAEYLETHPHVQVKDNPYPEIGTFAINVNKLNNWEYDENQWLRDLRKEPIDHVGYSWPIFVIDEKDLQWKTSL